MAARLAAARRRYGLALNTTPRVEFAASGAADDIDPLLALLLPMLLLMQLLMAELLAVLTEEGSEGNEETRREIAVV